MRKMRRKMRQINVYLPKFYIKVLDSLVKEGLYRTRAEAIRMAIREFIESEGDKMKIRKYVEEPLLEE